MWKSMESNFSKDMNKLRKFKQLKVKNRVRKLKNSIKVLSSWMAQAINQISELEQGFFSIFLGFEGHIQQRSGLISSSVLSDHFRRSLEIHILCQPPNLGWPVHGKHPTQNTVTTAPGSELLKTFLYFGFCLRNATQKSTARNISYSLCTWFWITFWSLHIQKPLTTNFSWPPHSIE